LTILVASRDGPPNPGSLHLRSQYEQVEGELRRRGLGPWDGCLAPHLAGLVVRAAPYPAVRLGRFTRVVPLSLVDGPPTKVSRRLMVNQSASCQVASDLSCLLSAGGVLKWGSGRLAEGLVFDGALVTGRPGLTRVIRLRASVLVAPSGQARPNASTVARRRRAKEGRSCHALAFESLYAFLGAKSTSILGCVGWLVRPSVRPSPTMRDYMEK
jgi:hypothetical protein